MKRPLLEEVREKCKEVAEQAVFVEIDRTALLACADNLVPHVLRLDGVLRYRQELAERIEGGSLPLDRQRRSRYAPVPCMRRN